MIIIAKVQLHTGEMLEVTEHLDAFNVSIDDDIVMSNAISSDVIKYLANVLRISEFSLIKERQLIAELLARK